MTKDYKLRAIYRVNATKPRGGYVKEYARNKKEALKWKSWLKKRGYNSIEITKVK